MASFYSKFNFSNDVLHYGSPQKKWLSVIRPHLFSDTHLIDVCCGNGDLSAKLAKDCRSVVGVDSEKSFIALAKKRYSTVKNLSFASADARDLARFAGKFEVAISTGSSFNHMLTLKDQVLFLKQIDLVLKPGGVAIIDAGWSKFPAEVRPDLTKYNFYKVKDYYVWNNYAIDLKSGECGVLKILSHTRKSLTRIIKSSKVVGLKISTIQISGGTKYILVVKKPYIYK